MSSDPKDIEKLVIEVLKQNKPMTKEDLIRRVAVSLGNGEVEDGSIEEVVENMADRMIILETGSGKSGKYSLNE